MRLRRGKKRPNTVSGAPFPPVEEHTDGPPDRPRHDVPTVPDDDVSSGASPETKTEPDTEEEDP